MTSRVAQVRVGAERIRCAKQYTLMSKDPSSAFYNLQLSKLRQYPVSSTRCSSCVREQLCQSLESPLFALAALLDSTDGRLGGVKDPLALFINLRIALEHCVLESGQAAEVRSAFFAKNLNQKLNSLGVVGSGTAAVFLLNFSYDSSFRTSVRALWSEDAMFATLFSHGLDVERYLHVASLDTNYSNELQHQNEGALPLGGNDFNVALVGTYETLCYMFCGSLLTNTWQTLHPSDLSQNRLKNACSGSLYTILKCNIQERLTHSVGCRIPSCASFQNQTQ
jgi:hypothetical protein